MADAPRTRALDLDPQSARSLGSALPVDRCHHQNVESRHYESLG